MARSLSTLGRGVAVQNPSPLTNLDFHLSEFAPLILVDTEAMGTKVVAIREEKAVVDMVEVEDIEVEAMVVVVVDIGLKVVVVMDTEVMDTEIDTVVVEVVTREEVVVVDTMEVEELRVEDIEVETVQEKEKRIKCVSWRNSLQNFPFYF
ncbi:hypothetical protein HID58_082681 [Brassica napus]|uniref:Uncharacterized protein n=1 Tax=Brassica napus TaxID=3708 RepID=A0ABQ7YED1_BRANA|nr:hypothetical protein HID58_082681 [Brassica napus]